MSSGSTGAEVYKCYKEVSFVDNNFSIYFFVYRVIAQLWPSISKFLTTEVCNLSISTTVPSVYHLSTTIPSILRYWYH